MAKDRSIIGTDSAVGRYGMNSGILIGTGGIVLIEEKTGEMADLPDGILQFPVEGMRQDIRMPDIIDRSSNRMRTGGTGKQEHTPGDSGQEMRGCMRLLIFNHGRYSGWE